MARIIMLLGFFSFTDCGTFICMQVLNYVFSRTMNLFIEKKLILYHRRTMNLFFQKILYYCSTDHSFWLIAVMQTLKIPRQQMLQKIVLSKTTRKCAKASLKIMLVCMKSTGLRNVLKHTQHWLRLTLLSTICIFYTHSAVLSYIKLI